MIDCVSLKKLIFKKILIRLLVSILLLPNLADAEAFLCLADIHFDPFTSCKNSPCAVIQKLKSTNATQWSKILAQSDTKIITDQDTNYALLQNILLAAKKMGDEKQIKFVIILGDFLGHDYRNQYKKYSLDTSRAGYRIFVNKTLQFLNNELHTAFPQMSVYTVIGNNDSYGGDYFSVPKGEFFAEMERLSIPLIKSSEERLAMQRNFSTAGYYAVDLPQNMRLIVLNSVIFSYKAYGKDISAAAQEELNWLEQQLQQAQNDHQQVMIAMHIPLEIGVSLTQYYRLKIMELWKPDYNKIFIQSLTNHADEITAILTGHLHSDWSEQISLNRTSFNKITIVGVPAISPIFGTKPGFKICSYDANDRNIQQQVYFYP